MPPPWFEDLSQGVKDSVFTVLTQAVSKYGKSNEKIKQDMKAKFGIENVNVEELIKYLYNENSRKLFFLNVLHHLFSIHFTRFL